MHAALTPGGSIARASPDRKAAWKYLDIINKDIFFNLDLPPSIHLPGLCCSPWHLDAGDECVCKPLLCSHSIF